MRLTSDHSVPQGYTVLESLLMMGLMTFLALMAWAIYLKETDPERKGPGVWGKEEQPFTPVFREVDEPLIRVPDPPLEDRTGTPPE